MRACPVPPRSVAVVALIVLLNVGARGSSTCRRWTSTSADYRRCPTGCSGRYKAKNVLLLTLLAAVVIGGVAKETRKRDRRGTRRPARCPRSGPSPRCAARAGRGRYRPVDLRDPALVLGVAVAVEDAASVTHDQSRRKPVAQTTVRTPRRRASSGSPPSSAAARPARSAAPAARRCPAPRIQRSIVSLMRSAVASAASRFAREVGGELAASPSPACEQAAVQAHAVAARTRAGRCRARRRGR